MYDPAPACFGVPTSTSAPRAAPTSGGHKITSFSVFSGIGTDFILVNANAGDNLHFATLTLAGGPNELANNFYPELLLYDNNGNLVAVAAGNAADGCNSAIDLTVPTAVLASGPSRSPRHPTRVAQPATASTACWLWERLVPCRASLSPAPRPRSGPSPPASHGHHRHLQRSGSGHVADARRAGGQRNRRHGRDLGQREYRGLVSPGERLRDGHRPAEHRDDWRRLVRQLRLRT